MRIAQVEINNFRGIQKATIHLPKHGVLFGPNNIGKTSIAEALAIALGREQMAPMLSDWDFFGGRPKPDSRILIIVTITAFADDAMPDDFPLWFRGETAAQPVWWSEKTRTLDCSADRPLEHQLATQIAFCARYDDEECEFEAIRFFYYGACDPFVTAQCHVPNRVLQELGVFLLPGNRQWDKLLSFSSSSFLKMLKSQGAIPGEAIESLKEELRQAGDAIGRDKTLSTILDQAERELAGFAMFKASWRIAYRPTALDSRAVMQSLIPHVEHDDFLLPFSRHGSGMNSLQVFLILLAFAEQRSKAGKNFILIAEEPELHLHPSLHTRLANRIQALSTQSLVTTHSSLLAGSYKPDQALFARKDGDNFIVSVLRTEAIASITKNVVRRLYTKNRIEVYEALMGATILVPEGETDRHWLMLWQRIVESADGAALAGPLAVIPTPDGGVVDCFAELERFRADAVPLVDGDSAGDGYVSALTSLRTPPRAIAQFGANAAIEALSAWILEPCLSKPGVFMSSLLKEAGATNAGELRRILVDKKKDMELRENLAWEAVENPGSVARAAEFISDLSLIASGHIPINVAWLPRSIGPTTVYRASHICKP
jgi:putative ATP-dependent endonuclease of OLD family